MNDPARIPFHVVGNEGDSISTSNRSAPGGPGSPAHWTSSAKTGVGTALSNKSCVWFTLSHGIFNEIYYPRIDQACIRDMGLIVTEGAGFFSEEKRDAGHQVEWLAEGVPAFRLINNCHDGRYRSIGAWLYAFFLVPETKGRSLEEIEAHWRTGKHPRAL